MGVAAPAPETRGFCSTAGASLSVKWEEERQRAETANLEEFILLSFEGRDDATDVHRVNRTSCCSRWRRDWRCLDIVNLSTGHPLIESDGQESRIVRGLLLEMIIQTHRRI